jgi:hypothetical protein
MTDNTEGSSMSSEPEPQRKMTPTERAHQIMLAALHRTPVKASEEVEVTRNAKGDYQFRVAGVAGEGETLAKVAARVLAISRDIDNDLPLSRTQIYGRDYTPNEKGAK